jgi:type IV secretion system protein VirD4
MTQWLADKLAYQSALGPCLWKLGDIRLYAPWSAAIWWLRYRNFAPPLFDIVAIALPVSCSPLLISLFILSRRDIDATPVTTYGSSRWAKRRDLRKAGLLARDGVILGRFGRRYLRQAGSDHILVFAPTRSGKGVGLVIPTLLSWTDSVVVHDIKGENWELTAGWRSRFSHCLCFDPTDRRSARYNPLFEVRRGAREVADVQNIADILIDPEGVLDRRNHWELASHALLVGAILHVLYVAQDKTLASVARLLSDPERPFAQTLEMMLHTQHLDGPEGTRTHPVVAAAARDLLNKSDAERSGILSTAIGFLSLYRDPIIASLTASSDWRIADLMEFGAPVSLYLVVPPSDIARTRPLIRLILNQIGRQLTERLPSELGAGRRLLLMLDEFPALGRLDFFETTLAFLAGYGVRAFLVAQSLHQIAKAYGENTSILDNCHIRIAFSTIIESCPQRILLPNDRAIEPQARAAYDRFGLNQRQIELIARATPKRHYYLQSARGNRLFELTLGPVALATCGASSPAAQARIDELLAQGDRAHFAPRFLAAEGLGWAAEMLEIPQINHRLQGAVL